MSKKNEEETITYTKNILNNFEDDNDNDDDNDDYDGEEEVDEEINENYDRDSLKYIENNILEYFNKVPLPLCEFLNKEKIDMFLKSL